MEFIPVSIAQSKIIETIKPGKNKMVSVETSNGYCISQNIFSPIDLPNFDQSAMDGYAFRFENNVTTQKFPVIGESSAGKSFSRKIKHGEAVRIFTGAEVPSGADTVIMQEKTIRSGNDVIFHDENIANGSNVRSRGSQVKKKELAVRKGSIVNPATVGFLISMGIKRIKVTTPPKVTIIITGNELQKPGSILKRGNIYESNSAMIRSALAKEGIASCKIYKTKDNIESIHRIFIRALSDSDFILFSGGISVGDYDFVNTVLKINKVNKIFYKVKQRPGGPLYFGTRGLRYIFGLPGNPASVLTCLYEYVIPGIRKFCGKNDAFLSKIYLPLENDLNKKPGLTHFLKASTDFKSVKVLAQQESYILRSYSNSNCLVKVEEDITELKKGEIVEVHLLNH